MEEIDLKELFEFLKSKIEVIIITTILICTLGCLYILFLQKPMYSSYTTVVLGGNNSNNDGSVDSNILGINNTLIETYASVAKSRVVIDKVIKNLKLNTTYEAVAGQVSVSAINKTQIIRIAVSDLDPEVAKDIANETAKAFIKEIERLYKLENIGVLDEAISPVAPYNINIPKTIIVCFLVGIVLSLAILFMIFYFDRTIKSTEQIEQKIKLPILGSVQDFSSKKGGKK